MSPKVEAAAATRNYLVKQDPGHIWSQSGRRSIMTSHRPKHR